MSCGSSFDVSSVLRQGCHFSMNSTIWVAVGGEAVSWILGSAHVVALDVKDGVLWT